MLLPEITELAITGIYARGVANQERIVLTAREYVNVGPYGLVLGIRAQQPGFAFPVSNNFLYFGDAVLAPGDTVFVYTCPGEPRKVPLPNNTSTLFTCFWGYKQTVLHSPEIVPMLLRFDGIHILDDGAPRLGKQQALPKRPTNK